MSLLESRLLDTEREKLDALSQLTQTNNLLDESKKQNTILYRQVETKNKEILLLRGQIQLLTQNKSAQEVELFALRGRVWPFCPDNHFVQISELESESKEIKSQVFRIHLFQITSSFSLQPRKRLERNQSTTFSFFTGRMRYELLLKSICIEFIFQTSNK